MVMACGKKVYGGMPLSTFGVAVMRIPGLTLPLGAETPVMIPVFATVATVAISGSTASKVKFAGMISPPAAVRAVAKSCVWKPAGKLADELLTSIHSIVGVFTATLKLPVVTTWACCAVAVI